MKLLILLLIPCLLQAQPNHIKNARFDDKTEKAIMPYHNAIGLFTNHSNWGLGISYDHRWEDAGFYINVSTGEFNDINYHQLKREYKVAAGILIGTWLIRPDPEWWPMLSFGMSYNRYTFYQGYHIEKGVPVSMPFDIELGVTGQIGRIAPFCATSLMKWQFMFGCKIMFNFRRI